MVADHIPSLASLGLHATDLVWFCFSPQFFLQYLLGGVLSCHTTPQMPPFSVHFEDGCQEVFLVYGTLGW